MVAEGELECPPTVTIHEWLAPMPGPTRQASSLCATASVQFTAAYSTPVAPKVTAMRSTSSPKFDPEMVTASAPLPDVSKARAPERLETAGAPYPLPAISKGSE